MNSRSPVDLDHRAPRSPGAAKEEAKIGEPVRRRGEHPSSSHPQIKLVSISSGHVSLDLRSLALCSAAAPNVKRNARSCGGRFYRGLQGL